MNATTYDPKTGLAATQPGARWGSVYAALNPYNVTVVGARTSVVGVGGFTTGAGYSFHSNGHGFSCDNVANWEIVLANGTVVNANANENADLWKAQKGGSGNLGFVTRIDQTTLPGTQLWGGFTQYDLKDRDAVFKAYMNFVDNTEDNSPDQNIVALFWDNKNEFTMQSVLTNANGEANRTAFKEYLSIPNLGSTLTTGPEKDIIPQFTGPTPLGQ
ncbi:hypothetical protein NLG97_g11406 [Lecanicillium saksenae]|uniref:Uncharacterized protein n=1 Tax=Lecanicillium saksenae TaxID=468837 RepID=A0ACC1QDL0_9HYPO|nr:hypothetical protein NLG97_g11406 [Lecanicillium saksenae]